MTIYQPQGLSAELDARASRGGRPGEVRSAIRAYLDSLASGAGYAPVQAPPGRMLPVVVGVPVEWVSELDAALGPQVPRPDGLRAAVRAYLDGRKS